MISGKRAGRPVRADRKEKLAELGHLFAKRPLAARSRLLDAGFDDQTLRLALESGLARRVRSGIYMAADRAETQFTDLLVAHELVPESGICLMTAAHLHGLTSEPPGAWLGIPHGKHAPSGLDVSYKRWSRPALCEEGMEIRDLDGYPARMTSPARTVLDLFREVRRDDTGEIPDSAFREARDAFAQNGGDPVEVATLAHRLGCPHELLDDWAEQSQYDAGGPRP